MDAKEVRDVATGARVATISSSSVSQSRKREKEREPVAAIFCHLDLITDHSIAAARSRRARRELTRRHAATGGLDASNFPQGAQAFGAINRDPESTRTLGIAVAHKQTPVVAEALVACILLIWPHAVDGVRMDNAAKLARRGSCCGRHANCRCHMATGRTQLARVHGDDSLGRATIRLEIDRSKSRPCVLELALWGNL